MMFSVCDRVENTVDQEKMLVSNISSFSHDVFERQIPQENQKSSLNGLGSIHNIQASPYFFGVTLTTLLVKVFNDDKLTLRKSISNDLYKSKQLTIQEIECLL